MIVVDTSVWIAHFRNELSDAVRMLRATGPARGILVGDIVMLEVLQGARDDAHAARLEATLRAQHVAPLLDDALAVEAAAHYRALRALGVTAHKTPDLIIASFCIAHGHALLHQDRDFEPFVKHCGLRVV